MVENKVTSHLMFFSFHCFYSWEVFKQAGAKLQPEARLCLYFAELGENHLLIDKCWWFWIKFEISDLLPLSFRS